MQQQEQHMNYDLLAVFSNQTDADNAESKLHKENYGDDEVFRLAGSSVVGGQFREHGPDRDRSSVFLQTTRQGPNPRLVIVLAIVFGLVLGAAMFAVADFAIQSHPILLATLAGVAVGVILGVIVGLLRKGPVRGAIGQDLSKVSTPAKEPEQEAQTVIAIRLLDPENISRKSKARAILINNKGKIDRSVGRDT
ncbi:MAG TPA: hypothetical protein VED37_12845 [Ktedonobacteraceae bacterium]|nr:hypothetical protein [Ktedonobacteraceae bacterium]